MGRAPNRRLMSSTVGQPRGVRLLLATQFLSSLADNALLIVTIAIVQRQGQPAWWVPLLKIMFLSTYVLSAPWLGQLADRHPKASIMLVMNTLKLVATLVLLVDVPPLAVFLLVGAGAAAYAPAKYGLLTELVRPSGLVAANAWLETSVVGAVLAGTVLGGWLVSPSFAVAVGGFSDGAGWWSTADPLGAAVIVVVAVYALSSALNLRVPDSGVRYSVRQLGLRVTLVDFLQANRVLWRDRLGGLSLIVTVLAWGAGAVLQLAVLRWAADVLGLGLESGAYLQAVVAVGIAGGAMLAARHVRLRAVPRMVPLGMLLGGLVMAGAAVDRLPTAWVLFAAVGAVGGLLIVPMNALLQHRGYVLLSSGRSVAVQGFNENLGVLLMLALYAGVLAAGLAVAHIFLLLGATLTLAMAGIWWWRGRALARCAPSTTVNL